MSEPVNAPLLSHIDGPLAAVTEIAQQGMITLRGDLSSAPVQDAARHTSGIDMPAPGMMSTKGEEGLFWMSPDEVLVLCPYSAVASRLEAMNQAIGTAHALAVNVSDARRVFRVHGPKAREVIGKLCPVDLSTTAFKQGMFRRTRMAQVPAAFWMPDDESFHIICFRSQAQYVRDALTVSARDGSGVNVY